MDNSAYLSTADKILCPVDGGNANSTILSIIIPTICMRASAHLVETSRCLCPRPRGSLGLSTL